MEPIVAVMLILGCDHSMMVCREAPEPVRQYVSVEDCRSEMDIRVREIDGYPMAVAQCIDVPGLAPGTRVAINWYVDPVGQLAAEASPDNTGQLMASADLQMASAERF